MAYILLASQAVAKMVTEGIAYEETGLPMIFQSTEERLSSTESELEKEFHNAWEPHERLPGESATGTVMLQAKL